MSKGGWMLQGWLVNGKPAHMLSSALCFGGLLVGGRQLDAGWKGQPGTGTLC